MAKISDTLKVVNHYASTTEPGVLNVVGKETQCLPHEWEPRTYVLTHGIGQTLRRALKFDEVQKISEE